LKEKHKSIRIERRREVLKGTEQSQLLKDDDLLDLKQKIMKSKTITGAYEETIFQREDLPILSS